MVEKKGRERYRRMQKRKSKSYKFSDKVHPIKGILSFVFAAFGIITFITTSYLSYTTKGNAGLLVGLVGVMALLFCVAGVILALMAMRQKDIHYRFPIIGGILCAIMLIGYIMMYTLGAIV